VSRSASTVRMSEVMAAIVGADARKGNLPFQHPDF